VWKGKNVTKDQATKLGKALLRKMKSKGWKLRVWENLGWHYCLVNPPLTLHPGIDGYWIFMTDKLNEADYGSYLWSMRDSFADPNEAVRAQVVLAQKNIKVLNETVDAANRIVQGKK
jgi:hypothetical protein